MAMFEKKISLEEYRIKLEGFSYFVRVVLVDWVKDQKTRYIFEGIDINDYVVDEIKELSESFSGVLPLENARKLWVILEENCNLTTEEVEEGSLWG
jgi:hypothetical protein